MRSLLFLSLSLTLAFISPTTAQDDDPTVTEWVTPTATLPSPWDSPSLYTTTNSAGSCEAFLSVYSSNRCAYQETSWPSTTTLIYPVDCQGCSELEVGVRRGNCPLGGHHTSLPPTSISTPRTVWWFGCAPTPGPVTTAAVGVLRGG